MTTIHRSLEQAVIGLASPLWVTLRIKRCTHMLRVRDLRAIFTVFDIDLTVRVFDYIRP